MARSKAHNEKMKDERREKILVAALEVFSKNGLSGTKISQIAKQAQMSQGLMYHYFASKEDIFTAVIQGAFERMNAACAFLESQPMNAEEKIRFAIEGFIKLFNEDEHASRYHFLIAQASVSDAVPAETKRIIETMYPLPYETMARIIASGQKEGLIREGDPQTMALLFWTAINGLAIYRASHGKLDMDMNSAYWMRSFVRNGSD